MALIEREAVKAFARENLTSPYAICSVEYVLDSIPAIDAAPVVHGKWINPDTLDCHCSICGEQPEREQGESVPLYDYCPYCGARMCGGEGHV